MAQSQNNLVVGIGVDSSKAKADLKLFGAEIQKFTKDLRDAVKAGNEAAAATAHQNLQQSIRLYDQLNASIKKTTASTREGARATREHGLSWREGGRAVAELAREAGFAVEGMRALKFGFAGLGVALVVRQFNEAIKSINDLNNAVKAIPGGKAEELKALQRSVVQDGQAADVATRAYTKYNEEREKARLRALQGGQLGTGGTTIARGGMGRQGASLLDIQTRAGVPGEIDWTDPFKAVTGRDRSKDDAADKIALAKAILAIKDATLQDLAVQKNYGVTFEQYKKTLNEIATGTLPKVEEETEKAKATLAEYNANVEKAKDAWNRVTEAVALNAAAIANASLKAQTYNNIIRARAADPTGGELPFTLSRPEEPGQASATLPAQAAGGYIRGPGSGTSDSILARLSNGEFVMRASAVQRYGVGLMQQMNSGYAGGGTVRFAAGGLVGGGGGTPVHLHLGGHVFATTASSSVASALVSEAHRQAVTSAGVKPSWFAARPGGR